MQAMKKAQNMTGNGPPGLIITYAIIWQITPKVTLQYALVRSMPQQQT